MKIRDHAQNTTEEVDVRLLHRVRFEHVVGHQTDATVGESIRRRVSPNSLRLLDDWRTILYDKFDVRVQLEQVETETACP